MSESESAKVSYYELLGVPTTATQQQIKKGYRKAALRLHPDHNKSPDATMRFQELARAHQCLSDPDKRALYDSHGVDDDQTQNFKDAKEYWRSVYPKITPNDIEEFKMKYVGSLMEEEDLISAYLKHEGDMALIAESVPFASSESINRLTSVLLALIESDKVTKTFKARVKMSKKNLSKKMAIEEGKEAQEAAVEATKLGLGEGEAGLRALIASRQMNRQQAQDSFLDSLAEKYSKPQKKRGTKSKIKSKTSSSGKKAKRPKKTK